MYDIPLIDWIVFGWFLIAWCGYAFLADTVWHSRRSLMSVMYSYRLRWMQEALRRDVRVGDASLLSTLIRSISLFASTAIFILGGLVAVLGSLEKARHIASDLVFLVKTSVVVWEFKILTLAVIFIYAFFKFAWSLRQFNYLLIVMGAFPTGEAVNTPEAENLAVRAAKVNALAVSTFNRGMRAYYFGLAAMSWFIHPYVFALSTLFVVLVVLRREFYSNTLRTLDPNEPVS